MSGSSRALSLALLLASAGAARAQGVPPSPSYADPFLYPSSRVGNFLGAGFSTEGAAYFKSYLEATPGKGVGGLISFEYGRPGGASDMFLAALFKVRGGTAKLWTTFFLDGSWEHEHISVGALANTSDFVFGRTALAMGGEIAPRTELEGWAGVELESDNLRSATGATFPIGAVVPRSITIGKHQWTFFVPLALRVSYAIVPHHMLDVEVRTQPGIDASGYKPPVEVLAGYRFAWERLVAGAGLEFGANLPTTVGLLLDVKWAFF
jgi:hypothetical protein